MFKKKIQSKKDEKLSKLPSSFMLIKNSLIDYKSNWKTYVRVSALYAIVYLVLVMGLSFSVDFQVNSITDGAQFGDALTSLLSVFSSSSLSGDNSSDATVLMQFLLFIVASMAFIWTITNLSKTQRPTLKDAYYKGTSKIVPTILVSFVLLITLIPSILGNSILAAALENGAVGIELTIAGTIAGLLILLAFYLFAMLLPAFYIVMQSETMPIKALKQAKNMTKKRRFALVLKILALALLLVLVLIIVLLPIALIVPFILPYAAFLTIFIVFGIGHLYMYKLYRSLA